MDNEVKGEGKSLNFKYRMHDPRVGRFFASDPLEKKYTMLTPYQFASNNPIGMKEIEGLEGDSKFLVYEAMRVAPKLGISEAEYIAKVRPFGNIPDEALMPLVETAAGFIPYVGQGIDAKDSYEAYNGGSGWDKVFATAAWIPGFDLFKGVRKLFKGADNIAHLTKDLNKLENAATKIDDLLKNNKSLAESFTKGKYDMVEAVEDITVYRISGGGKSKKGTGEFFSTVKPESSVQAEELLNVNKWGNTGTEVTPVTIKKGTQFATGGVAGGKGQQIFIPKDLQKSNGNNIIRHYNKTEKLE
jgi:RHS repeat-associated protein